MKKEEFDKANVFGKGNSNVKHWHGAKSNSWFSHIAVEVPG